MLRDLQRGRELSLRGHSGRIRHLELTARTLLSADSEGVVRRWELDSLGARQLQGEGTATRLATDGAHLASVDAAGTVYAWTLADGARVRLGKDSGHVTALAFAGGTVVTGTAEGGVTWWSSPPVTAKVPGVIASIAATRDRVAIASRAGAILLFTATGAPAGELAGHAGGTEALAFDPAGEVLVSGGQDRVLRAWRRDGDRFVASATAGGLHGDIHFVVFAPDGRRVFAAGSDGAVIAWDVRDGRLENAREIARHTGAVTAIAVGPQVVASAGRDNRVILTPTGGGAATITRLASAAVVLAIDAAGDIHAITRAMAVERAQGGQGVVEIDHGVQTGLALDAERWVVAHDDGTLLIEPLSSRRSGDLAAAIARATRFSLPPR